MKQQESAPGTDRVALVPHSREGATEKEPPPRAVCGQHGRQWGVGGGWGEPTRCCIPHTRFCPCLLLQQCVLEIILDSLTWGWLVLLKNRSLNYNRYTESQQVTHV